MLRQLAISALTFTLSSSALAQQAEPASARGSGNQEYWAYGLGGLGFVALGLGTYWALDSASKRRDADAICPRRRCSDERAVRLSRRSIAAGDRATVAVSLGLLATSGALWLFLDQEDAAGEPSVAVSPWIGESGGGGVARLQF